MTPSSRTLVDTYIILIYSFCLPFNRPLVARARSSSSVFHPAPALAPRAAAKLPPIARLQCHRVTPPRARSIAVAHDVSSGDFAPSEQGTRAIPSQDVLQQRALDVALELGARSLAPTASRAILSSFVARASSSRENTTTWTPLAMVCAKADGEIATFREQVAERARSARREPSARARDRGEGASTSLARTRSSARYVDKKVAISANDPNATVEGAPRVVDAVSGKRLAELRNRAVEAMRFAPSWLKQINMPRGTSPENVLPVVGTFDELYRLAQIASLNGSSEADIEAFFDARKEEVKVLELSSCEQRAIVTTNHRSKLHTISLRGTKNYKNVAQNLRLSTAPPKEGEGDIEVPMHRGYRNIAVRCREAFAPLLIKGYEVQLTGHSLGGAAAVALALLYHKSGDVKVRRVVTFGAPKLGPKETAQAIEDLDILRVVQKDDIIPLLPMSRPFVRRPYCHLGEGILLDNDNPGLFADLPREWGAAGIMWKQKMSIENVLGTPLKTERLPSDRGIEPPRRFVGAVRNRARTFLASLSLPTNESELEAEVEDLMQSTGSLSKASFMSVKEEQIAASASMDSATEDESIQTLQRIGPTIFERLWALRQFSREERIRRLDCHRMYRYVAAIEEAMNANPRRVQLAEIYDSKLMESQAASAMPTVPVLSEAILSLRRTR